MGIERTVCFERGLESGSEEGSPKRDLNQDHMRLKQNRVKSFEETGGTSEGLRKKKSDLMNMDTHTMTNRNTHPQPTQKNKHRNTQTNNNHTNSHTPQDLAEKFKHQIGAVIIKCKLPVYILEMLIQITSIFK